MTGEKVKKFVLGKRLQTRKSSLARVQPLVLSSFTTDVLHQILPGSVEKYRRGAGNY